MSYFPSTLQPFIQSTSNNSFRSYIGESSFVASISNLAYKIAKDKEENGKWITANGARFFIPKGESAEKVVNKRSKDKKTIPPEQSKREKEKEMDTLISLMSKDPEKAKELANEIMDRRKEIQRAKNEEAKRFSDALNKARKGDSTDLNRITKEREKAKRDIILKQNEVFRKAMKKLKEMSKK